jgi:hypothetical protein
MRKALIIVALAAGLAGCGFFRKTLGVSDTSPAHVSPTNTSIWGDWVLRAPDSTAFVGASLVEMKLEPARFTIVASYPGRSPITIRGSVSQADDGNLVTLEPQSGLDGIGSGSFAWGPGERVTVVASAADNTLVFAPPRDMTARPSSVWHRKAAAARAGVTPPPALPR